MVIAVDEWRSEPGPGGWERRAAAWKELGGCAGAHMARTPHHSEIACDTEAHKHPFRWHPEGEDGEQALAIGAGARAVRSSWAAPRSSSCRARSGRRGGLFAEALSLCCQAC